MNLRGYGARTFFDAMRLLRHHSERLTRELRSDEDRFKDASGTKRLIIVDPAIHDLKTIIENSTPGQRLFLLAGTHNVTSKITFPAHPLYIEGQDKDNTIIKADFGAADYLWANTSGNPPDESNGTIVRNITFSSGAYNVYFRAKRWYLYNCKFKDYAYPWGLSATRLKDCRIEQALNGTVYWGDDIVAEDCYINNVRIYPSNTTTTPAVFRNCEYIYETLHIEKGSVLLIGGRFRRGVTLATRSTYTPRPTLFALGVRFEESGYAVCRLDTLDNIAQVFPYVYLVNCIINRDDKILEVYESYVQLKKFVLMGCYLEPYSADINILYNNGGTIDHAIIAYNTGDDSTYNINLDTSQATLCEFDMNSGIIIT